MHEATAVRIVPDSDSVRLPSTGITTTASYYKIDVGGVSVVFFAARDESGTVHLALDRCRACAQRTPGFTQVSEAMRCESCSQSFSVASIGRTPEESGCSPVALPSRADASSVVIPRSSIEAGVNLFERHEKN